MSIDTDLSPLWRARSIARGTAPSKLHCVVSVAFDIFMLLALLLSARKTFFLSIRPAHL
jgi:hypothetical protein